MGQTRARGGYAVAHDGETYTPDGRIDVADVAAHNKHIERAELAWLHTAPDRVFLYVPTEPTAAYLRGDFRQAHGIGSITTWLGTVLDPRATFGPSRRFPCFGSFPSLRRAIECRIFEVRYVGWYYESSGSYCRLRKATRQ